MPPCRPGWRVLRSQARALCQSAAAALRVMGANRTGPATLSRHTGHGAFFCATEKPGNAGEAVKVERKIASGVAAQPARKRLALGTLYRCTPKGLANFGEV